MTEDFDIESLAYLEQTFFDTGYAEGHAHGRVLGLIEGRALGQEKGFEMWEELGFYEGFAKGWRALLKLRASEATTTERALQHIHHLLVLVNQFPQANPSSDEDIDISKLQRQIRSRYRALCSCLGVRPRLQLAPNSHDVSSSGPLIESELDMKIDDDEDHEHSSAPYSRISDRVAPGSAIPVWKIDKKSGLKSPVTNMDLSF